MKKDDLEYILDMIERMPDDIGEPEKFNRWVGFIQGVAWSYKLRTIEDMKNDNRISSRYGLEKIKEIVKEEVK